jgi:hypothetical protein
VENDGEAPCFSMQAVAGVPMAGTMQIARGTRRRILCRPP